MMTDCEHWQGQTAFYLDGELAEQERASFEAHLRECAVCRERCARAQHLLESVRQARPLVTAPAALRAKITQMLATAPEAATAPRRLRKRIQGSLRREGLARSRFRTRRAAAFALAALLLAASVWLIVRAYRPGSLDRPSEFALMAVETHQRYLRGQLPLEIATDSPQRISDWFAGKVPFSLRLPNYREAAGQEAAGQGPLYRLEGARLVGFKQDYAAYITYRMRDRPISLVATSNAATQPSGGEEIVSKGLVFHCDAINGLKVITWRDRGLVYALVSDLEERGQQSCAVCHEGTKDRDFFERLGHVRQL